MRAESGFEVGNFAMGEGLYTLRATPLCVGVFSEFPWWEPGPDGSAGLDALRPSVRRGMKTHDQSIPTNLSLGFPTLPEESPIPARPTGWQFTISGSVGCT